ncbi:MAG: hypothetical protein M1320_02210 [Patescibacteria group bacterium]|nr:hypothetical protein [Patescibacteria group bacterium]
MFIQNVQAAITTITVTSPNGGEIWSGTHNITWTTDGVGTDNVNIYRCIGGDCASNQTLITTVVATSSPYSWNTAGLNETDRIMVKDMVSGAFDASNATFTVDNTAPVISAVSITAGTYKIGSVIPVTITADAAGYTAGAITINGQALGGFTDAGAGSYTHRNLHGSFW